MMTDREKALAYFRHREAQIPMPGARAMYQEAIKALEQPTVEPERKTGRWTKAYDGNDGHVKCTGCFKTYDWISQAQYYNYCPNCGADMRGDKDDQR